MKRLTGRFILAAVFFLALVLAVSLGNAVAFNENFESGTEGWTTEGTWSLITTDHHGGANCMTDSPDGNYQPNEQSALISPSIKLSTATPLILTFWQHHSFCDAYGSVEISTDGGVNWNPLASYYDTVSTWQQKNIDLSAYSGETVKVRFLLSTVALGCQADGWYIDDISVDGIKLPTGPLPSYQEGFESGAEGWTTEGTWSLITTDHHGGANCMTDSPDGNYQPNEQSALISPSIKLSTATPLILTFWQHHSFCDAYGSVEISTDGGVNWNPLASYYDTVSTWQQKNIDLSAYSGETVKVRFLLSTVALGCQADGWYIDDIAIETDDRCPDDPNKLDPGKCGCGVADTDTDGDAIPDCNDNCPNTPNGSPINVSGCSASQKDYIMSNFGDDPGGNDPLATLKDVYMDGDGNGTFKDLYHSGSGSLESVPFTYSVNPHRRLTLNASGNSFHGVMSEGGDIFALAETTGGTGIDMAIKRSSGMSNASLAGEYVISEFDDSTSSNDPGAALTPLTLNGDGSGSVAYSVSGDGSLNMAGQNGVVSADGGIFTLAKTGGSYPGIIVGIRKSSGMSNASLSGDYIMSVLNDDAGDNDPWAGLLAVRMDGNGKGVCEEIYHSDNDPLESWSFTYSVSSDGTFTVDGDEVNHGIVSADGGIVTIADTSGDNGILVGIKNNNFICPSVSQKLSVAGKLFVDLAGYRTKEITNPVKFDEDTSRNKATTKFYAGWKKAENSATKKGLDCPTESKEIVQGLVEDALEEVYNKISEDVKPSGKDANKLVGDLLKATGVMCSAILNAESANVKKLSIKKLDTAWTKAKATFESNWHKAVVKAGKKGVSGLTDKDMHDVEDIMDNLVIAVSGMGL